MAVNVVVLGAGGFGIALTKLISSYSHCSVKLWSAVKTEIDEILKTSQNSKALPGVSIDLEKVEVTNEVNAVVDADLIIFAVASIFVRDVAKKISKYVKKEAILINVAKGLEQESCKRLTQVISEEISTNSVVAISGPSHAEEVSRFVPTMVTVASSNLEAAEIVQRLLSSSIFKIYLSEDVVGIEFAGALKNIIALIVGICDGLKFGDNTKAALMTRGMAEIRKLGVVFGANELTFLGLAGMGDLIVTCTSLHSRNRRAGVLIGEGFKVDEAIKKVGTTVEGVMAINVAHKLALKKGIDLPIIFNLYEILFEEKNVKDAVNFLLNKTVKFEMTKI